MTWTLLGRPQPLIVKDAAGTRAVRHDGRSQRERRHRPARSSRRCYPAFACCGTIRRSALFPPEVAAQPTIQDSTITWARDRLDGARRISPQHRGHSWRARRAGHFTAGSDGRIGLKITAVSGETPMTPLGGEAFAQRSTAQADAAARNALTFLSYREKFLAGSWRFNTYFGRDTLMSVRLLMPALTAAGGGRRPGRGADPSVAARRSGARGGHRRVRDSRSYACRRRQVGRADCSITR